MKNFGSEQRIYFPWESRGGLRRFFNIGRLRPIVIGLSLVGFLTVVGLRERERAGVRQTRATPCESQPKVTGIVPASTPAIGATTVVRPMARPW